VVQKKKKNIPLFFWTFCVTSVRSEVIASPSNPVLTLSLFLFSHLSVGRVTVGPQMYIYAIVLVTALFFLRTTIFSFPAPLIIGVDARTKKNTYIFSHANEEQVRLQPRLRRCPGNGPLTD